MQPNTTATNNLPLIVTSGGHVPGDVAPVRLGLSATASADIERGTLGKIMDLCTEAQVIADGLRIEPMRTLIHGIIDLITADGK